MLEMRPVCECCARPTPPEATDVWVCSMECTFCQPCVDGPLDGVCPNCGGELTRRPTRVGGTLKRNPASNTRIVKPEGCAHAGR